MGIKPKFNTSDIDNHVMREYEELENSLIETLQFVGEGFVADARAFTESQGGFGDITGNLRSSIGYFITKNGRVIVEDVKKSEKGTDRKTGVSVAKSFIDSIKQGDGLRLYGVAGMEYAREVENKGKNVISLQSDTAIIELKEILTEL
jgi:hypothetical protein